MKYAIPDEFRRRPLTIDLAGVGGTGSRLLTALAELHLALDNLGHPGLRVFAWDPDRVSESNVGRTAFAPGDIGKPKSALMITRLNMTFGLNWRAFAEEYRYPSPWSVERAGEPPSLVITCVDTLGTRADLCRQMLVGELPPPRLWLDCGNHAESGQVILGEPEWLGNPDGFRRRPRLPNVADVFPNMQEEADREDPDEPSCTLAMALGRQGLSINRLMADWAQTLLWRLLRDGGLDFHGVFVDARTGRTNPLAIPDPKPRVQEQAPVELPEQTAPRGRRRIRSSAGARPQLGTNRRGRLTAGGVR